MRVAIPVKESLEIFPNAGHTKYFGIFEIVGSGAFKNFKFVELRRNPKVEEEEHDHDCDEAEHVCSHADDEEHVKKHDLMTTVLNDCKYLLVSKACKNTVKSMNKVGIDVKKIPANAINANDALSKLLPELA